MGTLREIVIETALEIRGQHDDTPTQRKTVCHSFNIAAWLVAGGQIRIYGRSGALSCLVYLLSISFLPASFRHPLLSRSLAMEAVSSTSDNQKAGNACDHLLAALETEANDMRVFPEERSTRWLSARMDDLIATVNFPSELVSRDDNDNSVNAQRTVEALSDWAHRTEQASSTVALIQRLTSFVEHQQICIEIQGQQMDQALRPAIHDFLDTLTFSLQDISHALYTSTQLDSIVNQTSNQSNIGVRSVRAADLLERLDQWREQLSTPSSLDNNSSGAGPRSDDMGEREMNRPNLRLAPTFSSDGSSVDVDGFDPNFVPFGLDGVPSPSPSPSVSRSDIDRVDQTQLDEIQNEQSRIAQLGMDADSLHRRLTEQGSSRYLLVQHSSSGGQRMRTQERVSSGERETRVWLELYKTH